MLRRNEKYEASAGTLGEREPMLATETSPPTPVVYATARPMYATKVWDPGPESLSVAKNKNILRGWSRELRNVVQCIPIRPFLSFVARVFCCTSNRCKLYIEMCHQRQLKMRMLRALYVLDSWNIEGGHLCVVCRVGTYCR